MQQRSWLCAKCHNAESAAKAQKDFTAYWNVSQCPTRPFKNSQNAEMKAVQFILVFAAANPCAAKILLFFFRSALKNLLVCHCCSSFPSQTFQPSSFTLSLPGYLIYISIALHFCSLFSILTILPLLLPSSTILSFVFPFPHPSRNVDRIFPQRKKCIFNEQ